jgi:hypothetical protein
MDDLECFRRAAELGCKDFLADKHGTVWFQLPTGALLQGLHSVLLPAEKMAQASDWKRLNRYAAAVCAEWWAKIMDQVSASPDFSPGEGGSEQEKFDGVMQKFRDGESVELHPATELLHQQYEEAQDMVYAARSFGEKYGK